VIALDGSDPRASQFDKVLVLESRLDGLFSPKIGDSVLSPTNTRVQIVAGLSASTAVSQDNSAYNLDGTGVNEASGAVVIEAVITGVSLEDEKALNDLLDGSALGQDSNGNDFLGRVKYAAPGNGTGTDTGAASSPGSTSGTGNGGGSTGGTSGNGNGNGNGLGNGAGNGGHNNGNGNGGTDNGNGNGGNGNGNSGSGNANGGSGTTSGGASQSSGGSAGSTVTPTTVTVHIYITHR
jgi:hypothetical protein